MNLHEAEEKYDESSVYIPLSDDHHINHFITLLNHTIYTIFVKRPSISFATGNTHYCAVEYFKLLRTLLMHYYYITHALLRM